MSDTIFVNNVTLTDADWFNDLNRLHYSIFSDPADLATAISNLHIASSPINLGLSVSASGGILTVSLKGRNGNDPSSTNPVLVPFRSATASEGTISYLAVTSATSMTVSSGSTLGTDMITGFPKVWIVGFNDNGTFRLGVFVAYGDASTGSLKLHPLSSWGIASSTAEGGAGGADSSGTFYTDTAVTSKAFTVLGYAAWETSPGTTAWTSPTRVEIFRLGDPLPGAVIQKQHNFGSGLAQTGTTTIPFDNTSPSSSEGDEYVTHTITPTSCANLLEIEIDACLTNSAAGNMTLALFQDAGASAIEVVTAGIDTASRCVQLQLTHTMPAGTTSSTTFKARAGHSAAGTTTWNGSGGAGLFNSLMKGGIRIREISG